VAICASSGEQPRIALDGPHDRFAEFRLADYEPQETNPSLPLAAALVVVEPPAALVEPTDMPVSSLGLRLPLPLLSNKLDRLRSPGALRISPDHSRQASLHCPPRQLVLQCDHGIRDRFLLRLRSCQRSYCRGPR
jgi:hypothetical protein